MKGIDTATLYTKGKLHFPLFIRHMACDAQRLTKNHGVKRERCGAPLRTPLEREHRIRHLGRDGPLDGGR